jgi:hypothetical protein
MLYYTINVSNLIACYSLYIKTIRKAAERKGFFFEKKKQKLFAVGGATPVSL